jgi:hypothetical protein
VSGPGVAITTSETPRKAASSVMAASEGNNCRGGRR